MALDRYRHLPLDPAAGIVRDQDRRLAAAPPSRAPACQVQPSPRLRQRIGLRMRRDQPGVTRMQPLQQRRVARPQMPRRRAERLAADMRDEHARRGDVTPAEVAGAEAEIVLLAVALCEYVGAQQAHRIQAIPAHIHAEADADRDVHH